MKSLREFIKRAKRTTVMGAGIAVIGIRGTYRTLTTYLKTKKKK